MGITPRNGENKKQRGEGRAWRGASTCIQAVATGVWRRRQRSHLFSMFKRNPPFSGTPLQRRTAARSSARTRHRRIRLSRSAPDARFNRRLSCLARKSCGGTFHEPGQKSPPFPFIFVEPRIFTHYAPSRLLSLSYPLFPILLR